MFYGDIRNGGPEIGYDRTYSSRYEMEKFAIDDGVYFGRNVLVEYSIKPQYLLNKRENILDEEGNIVGTKEVYPTVLCDYTADLPDPAIEGRAIINEDIYIGQIVTALYDSEGKVVTDLINNQISVVLFNKKTKDDTKQHRGYVLTSVEKEKITHKIIAHDVMSGPELPNYTPDPEKNPPLNTDSVGYYDLNDQLDRIQFELKYTDKSYDSTIWQKTYAYNADGQGYEAYLMIAELNAVAPEIKYFQIPLPENNEDKGINPPTLVEGESSNSVYRMTVQAPWDLRIGTVDYNEENMDPDTYTYKIKPEGIDLSVYKKAVKDTGREYWHHNKETDKLEALSGDTEVPVGKELNVLIPSLGEAVANMWNKVYGNPIDGKRYTNINWEIGNPDKPRQRLVNYDAAGTIASFNQESLSTLAGCINSFQDLLGRMELVNGPANIQETTPHIYYNEGKFYRVVTKQDGHKETSEIKGFALNLKTIHGLFLTLLNLINDGDEHTTNPKTIQGIINGIDKIIQDALRDTMADIKLKGIEPVYNYGFGEHFNGINCLTSLNDILNASWDHITFGTEDDPSVHYKMREPIHGKEEGYGSIRAPREGDIYIKLPEGWDQGGNE